MSVLSIVLKFALVNITIRFLVCAEPVLSIVVKVTYVETSIWPL
jgi:hypothetical protein